MHCSMKYVSFFHYFPLLTNQYLSSFTMINNPEASSNALKIIKHSLPLAMTNTYYRLLLTIWLWVKTLYPWFPNIIHCFPMFSLIIVAYYPPLVGEHWPSLTHIDLLPYGRMFDQLVLAPFDWAPRRLVSIQGARQAGSGSAMDRSDKWWH